MGASQRTKPELFICFGTGIVPTVEAADQWRRSEER